MNVLLVGSGAREHAIAMAIRHSANTELFSFMSNGNPGIRKLSADSVVGNTKDAKAVVEYAKKHSIELAVIGPDAVLEAGIADALWEAGIPTVGPKKAAARIEWDKAFARGLMKKHGIEGCPKFGTFSNAAEAGKLIDELSGNVAVKPSGLTGGKGVKVVGAQLKDAAEAKAYCAEILSSNMGGLGQVVIEEKLEGEEFTLQAFTDGKTLRGMPCVQDNKLLLEGDLGPNTGSMGSYSIGKTLPFMNLDDYAKAIGIMEKTIEALSKEGALFQGILYGQFMLTKNGPKVIEFNARFGDPEAINVLCLLETDFIEICKRITEGTLGEKNVSFAERATVVKYLVPQGYPENPAKGEPIEVNERSMNRLGAQVFYASVEERDGKIFTASSRSIAVLGVSDSLGGAEKIAERACGLVKGNLYHRRDVGTEELARKRVEKMKGILRN